MKSANILIGILAITAIGLGFSLYNLHIENGNYKSDYSALNTVNIALSDELEFLGKSFSEFKIQQENNQKLIASLHGKISSLQNDLASSLQVSAPIEKITPIEVATVPEPEESTSNKSFLAIFDKLKNGEKMSDIVKTADDRFENEDVDTDWAYEYESNIHDFVANEESNSFNIQELTCKASACEMKITANENNVQRLGVLFSSAIGEQEWRDKDAAVMFSQEIKDGMMSIMIGRDGDSFK